MAEPARPRPSASVIIVRDGADSLEVLLVRRNARIAFHGGSWVFPGGSLDPADRTATGSDAEIAAAKSAAIREAEEEVAVQLRPETLLPFSHWTTPEVRPKRFSTWFFVAALAKNTAIKVDGHEIVDHRWYKIPQALDHRARHEIALPAPTFISLLHLRRHPTVAALRQYYSGIEPPVFKPRIVPLDDGECALYEGDAGYHNMGLEEPGQRHRLWMRPDGWHYENKDTNLI